MLLHRRRSPPLTLLGALRRRVLGFSLDEACFERRGFHLGHEGVRAAAERAARYAITGYGIGLEVGDPDAAAARLDMLETDARAYAYEGAAIGLTTLDCLRPRLGDRHLRFIAGPGRAYARPVCAGIGMALGAGGRTPLPAFEASLEPGVATMRVDGFGFFCGHSRTAETLDGGHVPASIADAERPLFDAGVGRSLWFVECGDPRRIAARVASLGPERADPLWSGVGTAATFLGGADADLLASLREIAGEHVEALRRGVALTLAIFDRAGHTPAHAEVVSRALGGVAKIAT